jgi:threonyl-tRNA synthetase
MLKMLRKTEDFFAKGEQIETIRHSLSHILAASVQELFPGAKFGIGPAIENGFYYDFALPSEASGEGGTFTREDLPKIEKKMKELIKKDIKFEKKMVSKTEAEKIFKDQPYKLELINEKLKMKNEKLTVYESGGFLDLCAGPHLKSTKELDPDAFKLTRIAGAYWLGDEKNKMLQRIYGVAFETKKELDGYFQKEVEAEKRDHRILGQKMELFMFDEEVGAGLPLWLPKGTILRRAIEEYLYKELSSQGYQWLTTPHIGNLNLWKKSGHWNFYRENMYSPIKIDEEEYMLKPMNCPFHVKIYTSKIRSYKNLPIYFAELGTVYRYERSGVLHGLTRVRGFTQDDAHIICEPSQISQEITKLVKYGLKILKTFGFKDYVIYLSTRPEKYAGTLNDWQKSTNTLKYVLGKLKLKYKVDPGGGVFYGPKIDVKIKDSLGREWQCTTIQFDFNLPERFEMTYINKKGQKKRPYMIHRALLGSMERFIGVLLEHYSGNLPLWLSPEQIWIIPISLKHAKYAKKADEMLQKEGLRTTLKDENGTISKKIRDGEIRKIPYILVVGDKEIKVNSVRVRSKGKDLGPVKLNSFLKRVKMEVESKNQSLRSL